MQHGDELRPTHASAAAKAISRSAGFAFADPVRRRIVARVEEKPGKAIVIVDDEMSFTDLLARLLAEHFSCPILTFGNPVTALEALPGIDVGVFVTDYYMPYINGVELIRKAPEWAPVAPPCLLITGHSFDDSELCRLPHFKGLLSKPFRWQQLAALIEQHWPAGSVVPLRGDASGL